MVPFVNRSCSGCGVSRPVLPTHNAWRMSRTSNASAIWHTHSPLLTPNTDDVLCQKHKQVLASPRGGALDNATRLLCRLVTLSRFLVPRDRWRLTRCSGALLSAHALVYAAALGDEADGLRRPRTGEIGTRFAFTFAFRATRVDSASCEGSTHGWGT